MRFAYLDASGDLAFRRLGANRGTTDYFVIVLLLMDDPVPVYTSIDELKDRLGMPRREEFRYSATSKIRRRAFLEELRRHEVSVRAVAINKVLIADRPETSNERLLYRDLVRRALIRHRDELDGTTLVLDEYIRGRQAQRQFNTMLRQAVNTAERHRLANVRHENSRSNNLIQAADMVAGAIYRSRAHNDESDLRIIQPRIREIWEWSGRADPDDPASTDVALLDPPRRKKRGKTDRFRDT